MIEIIDKKECCGCSACASICPKDCIEMEEDQEGFLYPFVNRSQCINCGACYRVCPVQNSKPDEPKPQQAFLVRNEDSKIRSESTSGGAFSAVAHWVIIQGGVVFGAAFDDNFEVHHTYVENNEELWRFRNSKYVQSRIGACYCEVKEFLKSGRIVLFSGTPCQTEGLYHYLGGTHANLILVDVCCRAVPSPLVWRKYKEYRHPKFNTKLKVASFRDKSLYGYQYSQMSMKYTNGTTQYSGVESDPYLRAFFSDLSDRPSCYNCAFKKRYRVSDLTIWDCFDVYRIDKSFDDNKGITRILVHSDKGVEIVHSLKNCTTVEIDAELAVKGVRELIESVVENPHRTEFFKDCIEMNVVDFFTKWFPDSPKVKAERFLRYSCERLGIYRPAKRIARKLLGKE